MEFKAKTKSVYLCSKCKQPKKGHTCPFAEPKKPICKPVKEPKQEPKKEPEDNVDKDAIIKDLHIRIKDLESVNMDLRNHISNAACKLTILEGKIDELEEELEESKNPYKQSCVDVYESIIDFAQAEYKNTEKSLKESMNKAPDYQFIGGCKLIYSDPIDETKPIPGKNDIKLFETSVSDLTARELSKCINIDQSTGSYIVYYPCRPVYFTCGYIQYKAYVVQCASNSGGFALIQENITTNVKRVLMPQIQKTDTSLNRKILYETNPINLENLDIKRMLEFDSNVAAKYYTPGKKIAQLAEMLSSYGMGTKYDESNSELWVKPDYLKLFLNTANKRGYKSAKLVLHGSGDYHNMCVDPLVFDLGKAGKNGLVMGIGCYVSPSDFIPYQYSNDKDFPKGTVLIGLLATDENPTKAYEEYHLGSSLNKEHSGQDVKDACVIRDQLRYLPLGLAVPKTK